MHTPLTRLFWREAEPRFDNLATLLGDLEAKPDEPELAPAPEAIDLAVLKRLAEVKAPRRARGRGVVVPRTWALRQLEADLDR